MNIIKSLEELKELALKGINVYIPINQSIKSIKYIEYIPNENKWYIYHHIDGTDEKINTEELVNESTIVKAIEDKKLYLC